MKCSDEEWQHCNKEKMGCNGCAYNDEISIGEYVRTHKGDIHKVIGIREEVKDGKRIYSHKAYYLDSKKGSLTEAFIIKHSKDIIDLIEVGDVIEFIEQTEGKDGTELYGKYIQGIYDENELKEVKKEVKENGIKIVGIATKEQIKQIEYRIKE